MPVDGWAPAEQEVDEPRARRLLAALPDLGDPESLRLDLLGVGWDNTVWCVDDRWAFRFPRRAGAVALGVRERAVAAIVADDLPTAVPVPRWVGPPTADYPWEFWGGAAVPGDELCRAGLADDERDDLATAVGGVLRALHSPDLATRVQDAVRLPRDPTARQDMRRRTTMGRASLERLIGLDPGVTDQVEALLVEAADLPAPATAPVLVHGDLHVRHLVVADGRLSGVIDWGDTCLAVPAVDLSIGYAAFDGAARERLFAAYGQRPDAVEELRARVLAAGLCAMLAVSAQALGDDALAVECRAGLRRSVS